LHFCCAYANAGEDQPILGSLTRYLRQTESHRDGLLVGSRWWTLVLPERFAFSDFLEVFQQVAAKYEIAGPLG
jgi:hypothetical protein